MHQTASNDGVAWPAHCNVLFGGDVVGDGDGDVCESGPRWELLAVNMQIGVLSEI
jgi:hypothetical protein